MVLVSILQLMQMMHREDGEMCMQIDSIKKRQTTIISLKPRFSLIIEHMRFVVFVHWTQIYKSRHARRICQYHFKYCNLDNAKITPTTTSKDVSYLQSQCLVTCFITNVNVCNLLYWNVNVCNLLYWNVNVCNLLYWNVNVLLFVLLAR